MEKPVDAESLKSENRARDDSNVTAVIRKLTKFGNLTIEFNKKMKTDLNITMISSNYSILDLESGLNSSDDFYFNLMTLYVVPNNDWNKEINGFEMKQINFTW